MPNDRSSIYFQAWQLRKQGVTWNKICELYPDVPRHSMRARVSELNALEIKLPKQDSATKSPQPLRITTNKNVQVIGDTHLPFALPGYLAWCKSIYDKFKCDLAVHIGDLADNHAQSFHESDPDGMSPGHEYIEARNHLDDWYNAYDKMYGLLGNHDRIPARKVKSAGLSSVFVRSMEEAWQMPKGWSWHQSLYINDIWITHGTGSSGKTPALNMAEKRRKSVISGHVHTTGGVWYSAGDDSTIFGANTGCGIDATAYAFEYGRNWPKGMVLGCLVLIAGRYPLFMPYEGD